MKAFVRIITPPEVPALLSEPGFGKWESTPRSDGRFAVRRTGAGVAILSGAFETEEEARREAAVMNGLALNLDLRRKQECLDEVAHPGPVGAAHCGCELCEAAS